MTYFRRYRMNFDLRTSLPDPPVLPPQYSLVPYQDALLRDHAVAKYQSFRHELDADVFPCLGRQDGCLRLMREISRRSGFVPEATWLLRYREVATGRELPVGTIQGIAAEGWGAIQNLGVVQQHRGHGLGTILMLKAAAGFRCVGLTRMHLEVTTENVGAVRLYQRLGFRQAEVVYKAAEIVGA